ncbi:MAG: pseudouridine synthase [Candidatus Eremiobacteraeota bacterium]|nr:pseudouridine synthase [Candidatus Eremiobacteraeota bacterium]
MKERLHKYLSRCGLASRRKAEALISQGRVCVNGEVAPPGGMLIDPLEDRVTLDGTAVEPPAAPVYYALHKPHGYTTTVQDAHAAKTVMELVPAYPRVYPVGRLDRDSSGLIILTNDGDLAQAVTHPSRGHEKEYEVYAACLKGTGRGALRSLLGKMEKGVALEEGVTSPAKVRILRLDERGALFHLILREGRNRQIRRMCQALGLRVESLRRVRVGALELGDLAPGEYRLVGREEILGKERQNGEN